MIAERSHEKFEIYGKPDRVDSERGRDWKTGQRSLPPAQHQFTNVLQVEGQVRWAGRFGTQTLEGRMYADMALENTFQLLSPKVENCNFGP